MELEIFPFLNMKCDSSIEKLYACFELLHAVVHSDRKKWMYHTYGAFKGDCPFFDNYCRRLIYRNYKVYSVWQHKSIKSMLEKGLIVFHFHYPIV